MKSSKKRLIIVILSALLFLTACISSMPSVQGAEPTITEKSMDILNLVAGFNVTECTSSLRASEQNSFLTLTQRETDFTLISSQGKLRARCSFVNGNLRQIFISDLNGAPSLNQPATDTLANAKGFLERYQSYTGASFYGELKSMLDAVNICENFTKTVANVKLTASIINQAFVDFMWTYVDEGGVPAMSKTVVLSYRNGYLKCFLDNWQFYKIAGTPHLSSEEAVAIALNASKDVSWNVKNTDKGIAVASGFEVASIGNLTLSYLNYREEGTARGGDPFTLYPSWYVPLGFDKVYPGCVTGAYVRVWADTGEVSGVSPMVSGGAPFSDCEQVLAAQNNAPTTFLMFPLAVAVVVATLGVSFYIARAVSSGRRSMRKSFFKSCGMLLCLLLSFGVLFAVVSPVGAIPADQNVKSMIYAAMYGQLEDEADAAEDVCDTIKTYFDNTGYDTTNAFGENTTYQYVIDNASRMEQDYDAVALFHFGHGGTGCYYDNDGTFIYSYDIGAETGGKHFFVFIWVCYQGNNWAYGMPVAWTQRYDLSSDAYYYPDEGSHCFIGFYMASPALSNRSFEYSSVLGKDVITKFYNYSLTWAYSVNDALDAASYDLFSLPYGSTELRTGYKTYWPENPTFPSPPGPPPDWYPGCMVVYGNGNIYLAKEYEVTVLAKDQSGNNLGSLNVYIDSQLVGTTGNSFLVSQTTHSFQVSTPQDYTFQNYTYCGGSSVNNPMTLNVSSDITITAYFNYTPPYHWLTVDACGNYHPYLPAPVSIDGGAWTGVAGDSFWVPEGYHSVEVPQYGYYQGVYYQFYTFYGYSGENPLYILVDYDKEVTAFYWGSY